MNDIVSKEIFLGTWSFHEIQLEDKSMYSEYIQNSECPTNLWSSNFDYLWAINQSKRNKVMWKVIDDLLVTFGFSKKNSLYLICLPFGRATSHKLSSVVLKCLKYCYEWNNKDRSKSNMKTMNREQLEFLRSSEVFLQNFKIIPLVGLEQHFSIHKLVALEGGEFRSLRKSINKFQKLYPEATLQGYRSEEFEEVMGLGEHWRNTAGQKYSRIFDTVYFGEIIQNFKSLSHRVWTIKMEGKIVGMISGGESPGGQSWGCLSKFMNEIEGLSEFMIVSFAREINKINPKIEYLNTGSDLGMPGLRRFKEKFRPVLSLKRYSVTLKETD